MDDKDIQLYFEEQRTLLTDLVEKIGSLTHWIGEMAKNNVQSVAKVAVDGEIKVNTEKEVEVSNLNAVKDWLAELGTTINEALEKNAPVSEVTVKNIKDGSNKSVTIDNLADFVKMFEPMVKAVQDKELKTEIIKQDIKLPTSAKDPIAVRLSDGDKFYKALETFVSGGGGSSVQSTLIRSVDGTQAVAVVSADGKTIDGVGKTDLLLSNTIKFATISASSSGDNAIVASVTGKKIKLLSTTLVSSGTVSVKWRSGTTDLSGAMPLVANSGFVLPASSPGQGHYLETAVNEALNINLSGAIQVSGHISYFEE